MLHQRPVIPLAACWVLGCLLAILWPGWWWNTWLTLACAVGLGVTGWLKPRGAWGIAGVLLLLMAAGWYGGYNSANRSQVILEAEEQEGVVLRGRVATLVRVDGDRVLLQAEAEEILLPAAGTAAAPAGPLQERVQLSLRLMSPEEQQLAGGWRRGDRIELKGKLQRPGTARNFEAFDYRQYLRLQHIHWQMTAKGLGEVRVTPPETGDWGLWRLLRWNDALRSSLGSKVEELFPPEQSGFMQGMLIGMSDEIDPEQFDAFSKLGLTHIIAISGLNVAIFLACLIWVLRRVGCTRETCLLTAIALMPCYIALTGASPSIVRAGLMAMIALYAAYRGKLKDGFHIALIAGVGMIVWNPYYLLDVSFQLSYLVTLGLILGVPVISSLLPIRHARLRDAVSITLTAQLLSFPLSIYYFNQFSLLSLAANFVLVPVFSTVIMPVGTVAMGLGYLSSAGGGALAWLVAKLNDLLFTAVEWSSGSLGFQTIWASPTPLWICLYYALLAAVLTAAHRRTAAAAADPNGTLTGPMLYTAAEEERRRLLGRMLTQAVLPAALLGWALLLWHGYHPVSEAADGQVQFLDVGQGDSILIRSLPDERMVLVDGGGTTLFRKPGEEWKNRSDPYEVGRKLLVPLLKKRGVQRINELILTHQDADHYGGLQAVLENIPVDRLLFNGTLKREAGVELLFRTALAQGTQLIAVHAGEELRLSSHTVLHFLHPAVGAGGEGLRLEGEQNPESIVFLMEMAGTRWLFTGDIGAETEADLLSSGALRKLEAGAGDASGTGTASSSAAISASMIPVDVLKVGHHGSKSSTTEAWLAYWQPRYAVISAGANNIYGHPSRQVLDRLSSHGTGVLRTDRDGEVQMTVRNGQIWVRTKLQP